MSLWLNLIPQLHRAIDRDDLSMRHHHFLEEGPQFYEGMIDFEIRLKKSQYFNEIFRQSSFCSFY